MAGPAAAVEGGGEGEEENRGPVREGGKGQATGTTEGRRAEAKDARAREEDAILTGTSLPEKHTRTAKAELWQDDI